MTQQLLFSQRRKGAKSFSRRLGENPFSRNDTTIISVVMREGFL